MSLETKDRIVSLDWLRVIAAAGVVAIHSDVITASVTNYVGGVSWWLVTLIHSFSRSSVPLFLMVSGSLFLGVEKK